MNTIISILISLALIGLSLGVPFYIGYRLRKWHHAKNPEPTTFFAKHFISIIILALTTVAIIIILIVGFLNRPAPIQRTRPGDELLYFKKIDMHEHFRAGGNVNYFLGAMAAANIKKMVLIPTDWPPSNPKYKENLAAALKVAKDYPGRFVVFATAWNKDPKAAEIIEDAIKNGAEGIKFIDWLYSKEFSATDAGAVDSPNMYKIYKVADKYKVPVLIHIDFQKKPEWKDQFWKVATDFPNVTFILPHYCRAASEKIPNLKLCADTLDKFPNVYTDVSMGGGLLRYIKYFDSDIKPFRDFIIKYQDRILWGSDTIDDGTLYKEAPKNAAWVYKRMLMEFFLFEHGTYRSTLDPESQINHKGFNLPRDVLNKIFWENPKRILNLQ